MDIKASESFATGDKTSSLLEIDAPDDVKREIGEYLIEQILASTSEQRSPIAGYGRFAPLSKKYKEKKEESGRSGVPNLDFDGDMLGSLEYELTEEGIEIGVFGSEAPKADGHNDFSGASELPLRRFLPDVGESFRKDISQEIEAIITEKALKTSSDEIDTETLDAAFETIESRAEFFDALSELTGIEERYLLKSAALSNPKIMRKIREYGLEDYLK